MRAEAIRGHLELLLLSELCRHPGHGYAVIAALRDASGGELDLFEGSVYPALHRLEAAGLVTSMWQPVGGRRRRVYRVTTAGRDALMAERRHWRCLVEVIERVLSAGPSAVAGLS